MGIEFERASNYHVSLLSILVTTDSMAPFKDGHAIPSLAPLAVLIQNPCPLDLPGTLAVAQAANLKRDSRQPCKLLSGFHNKSPIQNLKWMGSEL